MRLFKMLTQAKEVAKVGFGALTMAGGALGGFAGGVNAATKMDKPLSFTKNCEYRSRVIGFGVMKGLQYSMFPITYPLAKMTEENQKPNFLNKTIEEYAEDTAKSFKSKK